MSEDNVKVLVRCRPFNQREAAQGDFDIVQVDKELGQVKLQKPDAKDMNGRSTDKKVFHTFTYDAAYGEKSTQIEIFDESVRPMVSFVMKGYNTTIFAYGQTSAGKSHTMVGYGGQAGMIPQSVQFIFDEIAQAPPEKTYLIRCSYYEIYNEQIRDLMTNKLNLPLKETNEKGVFIDELTEYKVKCQKEVEELMDKGAKNRSVGATNMNATSSRSHSIFQIVVECATETGEKTHIAVGKLNLVDLAGSERADKTGATGERLKEGAKINLSLSCLGQVIQKLVLGDDFIPYRQSKLTHILKDSLGGNSKTLMIAAISPASTNYEETHSTLRYADQAKRIKNKAKINEDPKDAQIREMREQIEKLEKQLAQYLGGAPPQTAEQEALQLQNIQEIQRQLTTMNVYKKKVVKKTDPAALERERKEKAALEKLLKENVRKSKEAEKIAAEMRKDLEEKQKQLEGAQKLKDEAEKLEREQRAARQALADQRKAQMLMKRQIQEEQQRKQDEMGQITNIQEKRDVLRRKLEKYLQLEKETEAEVSVVQKENAKELQLKQADVEDLQRLLEQKTKVLDQFIPKEIQERLARLAVWDAQAEQWRFKK